MEITANIPHFAYPFTMVMDGTHTPVGVAVAEQDSIDDIVGCVHDICDCRIGNWIENPNFGIPNLTFNQMPLNDQAIVQAIRLWEGRATTDSVEQMIDPILAAPATEKINLTVSPLDATGQ